MKPFLKTLFSLFAILGVTVGEVKSSTITDLGANRLSEVTVSAKMTDHQSIMSNPVVQDMHKAQGEFWSIPAPQVVLGVLPIGGVAEGVAWAGRGAKALFSGSKAAKAAIPQYTKSSLKLGQQMHKAYKVDLHNPSRQMFKEYRGISGIRPDFVDLSTKIIYELKPFNPRGIQMGTQQLNRYKTIFETKYPGTTWKTVLDLY
jgi:hypothetical protein